MTARDYGWVSLPSLMVLVIAPLVEWVIGPEQVVSAVIAVALTWPVGIASVWGMRRLMARDPRRSAVGWVAASLLRMAVALGGGCAFFFGRDWEPATGVALWVWIVVAYLSTLAAEVFVLAKPGWVGRGGGGKKG